MMVNLLNRLVFTGLVTMLILPVSAQYKPVEHRTINADEIAVTRAGNFDKPGATYVLANNINSPMSAVFVGNDVTLDLNGYTISYADGNYDHVQNPGFEEGVAGWDLSKAPGAKVMNTKDIHEFVGKKLMSLQPGDEIVSSYVHLPLANRSYIAMCGITGRHYEDLKGSNANEMKVSVFVEDEKGNEVRCTTEYMDSTMVSTPIEKRSPQLGGGFVFAHLSNLSAGKYRVRVRADTDCLVDEIDIRPAFDVGVGIIGKTYKRGHNDDITEYKLAAFVDYTKDPETGTPLSGLPTVQGMGTVTIKNGVIENRTLGAISFGVQSTAPNVRVILENVEIKTVGINTIAVDAPQASITNCRFDVRSPFMISRHNSNFYAVDLTGPEASEVSFSEFYGGQGCLVFKGNKTSVHDNFFANRQMVTNHYSIMAMGDSSWIYNNRIEPEVGSGIEIYRHRYIQIFNNTIRIETSPPTCEYGMTDYSTAAVRIADYLTKAGDPRGAFGNRVYNNKIFVTAKNYLEPKSYIPASWAFFFSASGGENYIYGNDIDITHTEPRSKAETLAFYICGGQNGYGGQFFNNTIRTNVSAMWLASRYGGTANTKVYGNTLIRKEGSDTTFRLIRMGSEGCAHCFAKDVEFRSNEIVGDTFYVDRTSQDHSLSVYWTLSIDLKDKKGKAAANQSVILTNAQKEVTELRTDENGVIRTELPSYMVRDGKTIFSTPYTVKAGRAKRVVALHGNTHLEMRMK